MSGPVRNCIDDACFHVGECAWTDEDGNCPVLRRAETAREEEAPAMAEPTKLDWLKQVQAYHARTGDDKRELYLACLVFIDREYPGALDFSVRRLNEIYPEGIDMRPRAPVPSVEHDQNCGEVGGCGPECPWCAYPEAPASTEATTP